MPTKPQSPPFHFHGRRKGRKLRPAQAAHLAWVMENYAIDKASVKPAGATPIATLFGEMPAACYLEIGFGGGEHLAELAAASPKTGFIGAEVFINGIASLGRHIAEGNLTNIRIWADDVRLLLPALPKASLAGVYILFPDPWPKTRHAKRRLVQPATLDALAGCIKSGGFLLLASDDATAKSWLLEVACQHPQFAWQATSPQDWRTPPQASPPTRYMQKATHSGRSPSWFYFLRA